MGPSKLRKTIKFHKASYESYNGYKRVPHKSKNLENFLMTFDSEK
uniref:Uncharacterized protein n=1 Tax=Rhizophora mucronata TaxID=61149 RepID=A0A2P2QTQ3_RHIMU